MSVLDVLKESVIAGDEKKVLEYTQKALDEGTALEKILDEAKWHSLMHSVSNTADSFEDFAKNAERTVSAMRKTIRNIDTLVVDNRADIRNAVADARKLPQVIEY